MRLRIPPPDRAVHKLLRAQGLRYSQEDDACGAPSAQMRPESAAAHSLADTRQRKYAIPLANKSRLDHHASRFQSHPRKRLLLLPLLKPYNAGMLRDGVRGLVRGALGRRSAGDRFGE